MILYVSSIYFTKNIYFSDIEELNEEDEDDNLDEFFNVVEQNFHDEVIHFLFCFL